MSLNFYKYPNLLIFFKFTLLCMTSVHNSVTYLLRQKGAFDA